MAKRANLKGHSVGTCSNQDEESDEVEGRSISETA